MKKFFSAILLMTAMVLSVGTFVACNDLTEEMEAVQTQATQNSAAIKALETQISALQTALATAQSTADAAKKAGDAATAAAATAKAEAIAAAKDEVAALKAIYEAKVKDLEAALAGKASKEDLQKAIDDATAGLNTLAATLGARIDGIEAGLNKLATVAQLNEEVAKLVAADADLALQIAALKAYSDTTYATVAEAEAIRGLLADLAEKAGVMEGWIGTNTSMIATLVEDVDIINAALKTYMDETDATISDIAVRLATALETADAAADKANMIEEALAAYMPETDKKISDIAVQIASALEDIDNLGQLIETANANISLVASAVSSAADDIDLLKADVATLKAGLEAVTPRVEDLEEEVATISTDLSTLAVLVKNTLRSITFAPKTIIDGVEAIEFANFEYKPMAKVDDKFNAAPKGYNTSISEAAYAYYHFNPSSFDLTKATYTYKDRAVDVKSGSALVTIEAAPKAMTDGTVEFKLRRDNTTKNTKDNMIALEATITADNNLVRSPYVLVKDSYNYQSELFVADSKTLRHYFTTAQAAADSEPWYTLVWDGELDFEPLAVACLHDGENHHVWDVEEKYGFTFRYSVAPIELFAYDTEETWTEQQRVLNAPNANENGVNALFTANPNRESIGRTPIVLVEILDAAGQIVRYGYVKIEVVAQPEEDVERELSIATITYDCQKEEYIGSKAFDNAAGATIQTPFDETWFQDNLYKTLTDGFNVKGLSHQEFWAMYAWDEAATTVTKNGVAYSMPAPYIAEGSGSVGTLTKIVAWTFDHSDLGKIGEAGSTFEGTVVLRNKVVNSEYPANIALTIKFKVVLPEVAFEATKETLYWNQNGEFVINPTIPDSPEATSEYFFYDQNIYEAYLGQKVTVKTAAKAACFTSGYELTKVYEDATKPFKDFGGISFDGQKFYFDELTADAEKALNKGTLKAHFTYYVTFNSGDKVKINDMYATIVKPVYMNLNIDPKLELKDAQDNGDQVEINYQGMFTDWRGFQITKGEEVYVPFTYYEWVLDCAGNHGYYKATEKASVAISTTTYTVPADVTLYTASIRAKLYNENLQTGEVRDNNFNEFKTFTTTPQPTKADALTALQALIAEDNAKIAKEGYKWNGMTLVVEDEEGSYILEWRFDANEVAYTETVTTGETEVTIVTETEYTETVYEWVEVACDTVAPEVDGEYAGQKNGCWIWTEKQFNKPEVQGLQYWDFYGMADCFDLVLEKVTTNLEHGKLPEGAKLEQVGTTLKYRNVHSPVLRDYEMYIPVTMGYKFGTLEGTLTITVKSIYTE